jgi:hypothetical protein
VWNMISVMDMPRHRLAPVVLNLLLRSTRVNLRTSIIVGCTCIESVASLNSCKLDITIHYR